MTRAPHAQIPTPQLDTTTPAVILKLDRNIMHHGGLGAIRSLGRLGVPVYGVHEDAWAPAARPRHLHDRSIWPPPLDAAPRLPPGPWPPAFPTRFPPRTRSPPDGRPLRAPRNLTTAPPVRVGRTI